MIQKVVRIPVEDTIPTPASVLAGLGIPRSKQPGERTQSMVENAMKLYQAKADPVGIILEIGKDEFMALFEGEGLNDRSSPVYPICRNSDNLALFAVTIGREICEEISRLFDQREFAPGSILDSIASEGTENTAQMIENTYRRYLLEQNRFNSGHGLLRFSPGYCGWHVSGQKKLFNFLRPGEIAITLNESYLMQPLKSITGVIISGGKNIFDFEDTFPFCKECATHTCRERIQSVMEP